MGRQAGREWGAAGRGACAGCSMQAAAACRQRRAGSALHAAPCMPRRCSALPRPPPGYRRTPPRCKPSEWLRSPRAGPCGTPAAHGCRKGRVRLGVLGPLRPTASEQASRRLVSAQKPAAEAPAPPPDAPLPKLRKPLPLGSSSAPAPSAPPPAPRTRSARALSPARAHASISDAYVRSLGRVPEPSMSSSTLNARCSWPARPAAVTSAFHTAASEGMRAAFKSSTSANARSSSTSCLRLRAGQRAGTGERDKQAGRAGRGGAPRAQLGQLQRCGACAAPSVEPQRAGPKPRSPAPPTKPHTHRSEAGSRWICSAHALTTALYTILSAGTPSAFIWPYSWNACSASPAAAHAAGQAWGAGRRGVGAGGARRGGRGEGEGTGGLRPHAARPLASPLAVHGTAYGPAQLPASPPPEMSVV